MQRSEKPIKLKLNHHIFRIHICQFQLHHITQVIKSHKQFLVQKQHKWCIIYIYKLKMIINFLTMGLSGSLGSVMTKFFSIRSSVVARSRPFLFSLFLIFSSTLSGLSSSSELSSSSASCSSLKLSLFDKLFLMNLQKHVYKLLMTLNTSKKKTHIFSN